MVNKAGFVSILQFRSTKSEAVTARLSVVDGSVKVTTYGHTKVELDGSKRTSISYPIPSSITSLPGVQIGTAYFEESDIVEQNEANGGFSVSIDGSSLTMKGKWWGPWSELHAPIKIRFKVPDGTEGTGVFEDQRGGIRDFLGNLGIPLPILVVVVIAVVVLLFLALRK